MNLPLSPLSPRFLNQSVDQAKPLDSKTSLNKTVRFISVSDFFQKQLGISQPIAEDMQQKIALKQKTLRCHPNQQLNDSFKIPLSGNFPFDVVITKKRIHVFMQLAATGTFTKVHKAFVLTTHRHQLEGENFSPLTFKVKAVKETIGMVGQVATYTPEKNRLSQIKTKRGLDFPEDTFKQPDGHGYSMQEFYDKDLTKIKFDLLPNPVSFIVNVLMKVCDGLKNLHDAGIIHRDIKGANIVIMEREADLDENVANASPDVDFKCTLTDFGLAKFEKIISKQTTGTAEYLDPALFGSLEECLVNQKIRPGLQQTKGHDIYALGITLFRDLLMPFIINKCSNHPDPEFHNILENLKIRNKPGPFTDQQLKDYGKISNHRVIYLYNSKKSVEFLIKYPELDDMSKNLKEAISRLGNSSEQDKDSLMNLSDLCCLMQAPKKDRPTIDQVIMILEKIKEYSAQSQHDSPLKRVKADLNKLFNGEWQKDFDPPTSQVPPTQPTRPIRSTRSTRSTQLTQPTQPTRSTRSTQPTQPTQLVSSQPTPTLLSHISQTQLISSQN